MPEADHRLNQRVAYVFEKARTRTVNGLWGAGYRTMADVCRAKPADLMQIPNFGKSSLEETKRILAGYGLSLGMDC